MGMSSSETCPVAACICNQLRANLGDHSGKLGAKTCVAFSCAGCMRPVSVEILRETAEMRFPPLEVLGVLGHINLEAELQSEPAEWGDGFALARLGNAAVTERGSLSPQAQILLER